MTMTATGLESNIAYFRRLNQTALRAAEEGVERALRAMADTLADYPPELPNQRYKRTFRLRDGWNDAVPFLEVMDDGLFGSLTNPTSYGPEVEGELQKPIHQGRWPTVAGVQEAQADTARDMIARAINAGVKRG